MNRRVQREHIFRALFSYEFDMKEDFNQHIDFYLADIESDDMASKVFIKEKTLRIIENIEEIDQVICKKALDWDISRIAKVEIAILRLAVYEIMFDPEIPDGVAINEAVELAKKYGTDDHAPSFVNGVLAQVVK